MKELLPKLISLLENTLNTYNISQEDITDVKDVYNLIDKINQKIIKETDPYILKDLNRDIRMLKKWRKDLIKEK